VVLAVIAPLFLNKLGPQGGQIATAAVQYALRLEHQVISFTDSLVENAIKGNTQGGNSGTPGWGNGGAPGFGNNPAGIGNNGTGAGNAPAPSH